MPCKKLSGSYWWTLQDEENSTFLSAAENKHGLCNWYQTIDSLSSNFWHPLETTIFRLVLLKKINRNKVGQTTSGLQLTDETWVPYHSRIDNNIYMPQQPWLKQKRSEKGNHLHWFNACDTSPPIQPCYYKETWLWWTGRADAQRLL